MANNKEWQRRSDEWVAAMHKSRLQKEANSETTGHYRILTRIKATSANILELVTDPRSRLTRKRHDHEQR